jgi:hypothetical protein
MTMIKALMLSLALMVPTLAQANSEQTSLCESFSGLALSVAQARDLGIPEADVVGVLLASGFNFEMAIRISVSVHSEFKGLTPLGVKKEYCLMCMGEAL